MAHTVNVPNRIWVYFQKASGKTMPGNEIRDALYAHMIEHPLDVVYTGPMEDTNTAMQELRKPVAYRLRTLGLQPDLFDTQFSNAIVAFVEAHNGDIDAALGWMEKAVTERGLKNPRGWLVDWYKNLPAEAEANA